MDENPYKAVNTDYLVQLLQTKDAEIVSLKAEVRVGWDAIARQRETIRDMTVQIYPDATFHDVCPDCGATTITDKDRNILVHFTKTDATVTPCPGRPVPDPPDRPNYEDAERFEAIAQQEEADTGGSDYDGRPGNAYGGWDAASQV